MTPLAEPSDAILVCPRDRLNELRVHANLSPITDTDMSGPILTHNMSNTRRHPENQTESAGLHTGTGALTDAFATAIHVEEQELSTSGFIPVAIGRQPSVRATRGTKRKSSIILSYLRLPNSLDGIPASSSPQPVGTCNRYPSFIRGRGPFGDWDPATKVWGM